MSRVIFSIIFCRRTRKLLQDPDAWKEWDALIKKYQNDRNIQILHALRIGLCAKIDQDSITFEMANDLVNHTHEIIIEKKKAEKKSNNRDL